MHIFSKVSSVVTNSSANVCVCVCVWYKKTYFCIVSTVLQHQRENNTERGRKIRLCLLLKKEEKCFLVKFIYSVKF